MNSAPSMLHLAEDCAIPDGWTPSLNHGSEEEEKQVAEILEVEHIPVPQAVEEPPRKRVKITDGLAVMPPRFRAKKVAKAIELQTYAEFEKDQAYALLNFIERADGSDVVEGYLEAENKESDGDLDESVDSVEEIRKDEEVAGLAPEVASNGNVKIGVVTAKQPLTAEAVKEVGGGENAQQVPVRTVRFSLGTALVREVKNARKRGEKKPDDLPSRKKDVNAKPKQAPNAERLGSLRARTRLDGVPAATKNTNAGPSNESEGKVLEAPLEGAKAARPIIKLRKGSRTSKPSTRATDTIDKENSPSAKQSHPGPSTLPESPKWRRVMAAPEL